MHDNDSSSAESRWRAEAPPLDSRVSSARVWILVVIAGLAAGFASWYAGEAVFGHYQPKLVGVAVMQTVAQRATPETEALAEVQNAALAFAILGATLGIALGLAGGLARANLGAALGAAFAGLLLGGAFGYVAAWLAVPLYRQSYQPLSESLIPPLLCHGAIWSAVGVAGGLAFGAGFKGARVGPAVLGGFIGALLGTIVYELAAAAVFPLDRTFQPLSNSSMSRLLARLSVTLLVAAGAAIGARSSGLVGSTRASAPTNSGPTNVVA